MIRELALEAIAYLDANDLVTIPPLCRDSWRMTMMSPEQQLVNPVLPGRRDDHRLLSRRARMPHEAKMMSMRGNNRHFARATVHHELIPGHHLQGYMTARHKTYRRLFSTPFFDRGLGALLGALALGPRLREVAREPRRHAVLADAPMRPDHLLAELPPRADDAQASASTSWSTRSATSATTPRPRSAARSTARTARSTRRPICSAGCSSARSIASWSSRAR